MHLPKPTEGGDFAPVPEGTFPATCFRFIDLGTQMNTFEGNKLQRKIMLSWEITDPDTLMTDGRPFTISSRFTWSTHEKATLRKTLESWRGKKFEDADFGQGGFDTHKLLGVGCFLSIVHAVKDGKTFANIAGVVKLPNGLSATPPQNPMVYLSLEPDEFDRDVFNGLSDGLRDVIMKSPEYGVLMMPKQQHDDAIGMDERPFADTEIPF